MSNHEECLKSIIEIALQKDKNHEELMQEITIVVNDYQSTQSEKLHEGVNISFASRQFFAVKARQEYLDELNLTNEDYENLSNLEKIASKKEINKKLEKMIQKSAENRKVVPATFKEVISEDLKDIDYQKIENEWKKEQLNEINAEILRNTNRIEKLLHKNEQNPSDFILKMNSDEIEFLQEENKKHLIEQKKYI